MYVYIYIHTYITSLEKADDDAGERKQDWMQKLAMRICLHLNCLPHPSTLCRFFATSGFGVWVTHTIDPPQSAVLQITF